MMRQLIEQAMENPRKLLLMDGCGALLSAFLLGIVLVQFQAYFGIPYKTLYLLALLPCFFAVYDFYYYRKDNIDLSKTLRNIAFLNISYCILSAVLAIYHYSLLTVLAWVYIINEIILVLVLAFVELKTAASMRQLGN